MVIASEKVYCGQIVSDMTAVNLSPLLDLSINRSKQYTLFYKKVSDASSEFQQILVLELS